MLLLVGEPGIGKTRLAEELATYAGLRGAQVLWGRCYEWEGAPAYWPWVQIIRAYVHDRDPQALRSELGPGRRRHRPGRLRGPRAAAGPASTAGDGAGAGALPAVRRHRDASCRTPRSDQPLVLVLDDLHWADKPSLLLLEFLARELRAARLLVSAPTATSRSAASIRSRRRWPS